MLWNELSLNTRSQEEKYAWGTTTYDTKTESGFTLNFQRGDGAEEQMFASSNLSFSGGFSAGKSNFLQLPGKGSDIFFHSFTFILYISDVETELYIISFGRCRRILRRPP